MPPARRKTPRRKATSSSRKATSGRSSARCVFVDRFGARCVRNGFGRPALCRAHVVAAAEARDERTAGADPLGTFFASLFRGGSPAQATVAGAFVGAALGAIFGVGANAARPQIPSHASPFPPFGFGQPRPAPPPDPRIAQLAQARTVLGFGITERPDRATITRRRHELARKHHPDLGGSPDLMARINAAADLLLEETS